MLTGRRIVLVEDDEIMGASIDQRLRLEGADVQWLKLMRPSVGALRTPRMPVDAVVCDIRLPDGSGEDLFTTLCRTIVPPPFVFITGEGTTDQAVRLMQAGAVDYVSKPFEIASLLERLAHVMRPQIRSDFSNLMGISQAARQVEQQAALAAASNRPLLIRAEAGTGKALLARHIHRQSDRQAAPFLTVQPGRTDIPPDVLMRLVMDAGEGVVFVDDLGRLPLPSQDWLMGWLDYDSPARLIVACDAHGSEHVRTDLMARLDSSAILITALRERPEDAVWLLHHLIGPLAARAGRVRPDISDLAAQAVRDHDWPGNGRELRSRLAHALTAMTGDTLFPADLFPEAASPEDRPLRSLAEERDRAERAHILRALERSKGQVTEAARLLEVSRTTLWEKMTKFGI